MGTKTKITPENIRQLILCLTKKNIYSTLIIDIHDGIIVSAGANLKSRSQEEIKKHIEVLK